ncbi:uncharacterized protein LOC110920260 [Helianthus annuus]|uniref:uncharacterized protein LOC110920260 n=1 Tax=Helianthus annuus TaxID=4232 RepID=UPI000B8F0003|nr:uncharacterized protein LOC110920260 [Helianthus annuus]
MKKVGKEVVKYLGDYQFGVGVPNGAEAVLHSANRFLNSFHSDSSLAMLTVNFSNAFNLVDRSVLLREVHCHCPSIFPWVQFLYAQPARLYMGNDRIGVFTGVQQGDPLGPLLFALALHPLVLRVQENCKLPFHALYLDDGTVIGDAVQVAKALDIIGSEGPAMGLRLNIRKTEVFWPTCNGVKVRTRLFPNEIGRPERGVKLLGGAVSRDASFISRLAAKRATRAVDIMGHLLLLRDPQSELLLLRSCMGVAKLLFGLRTCQPPFVDDAVSRFDKGLREAIEDIVDHILRNSGVANTDPDYASALERLQESLPNFDLGDFFNNDTAPKKPQKALANALCCRIAQSLGEDFHLSPRQKAVIECLQRPHAQDFLTVIPIEGLGQRMSAVEHQSILKYRLMIPMLPNNKTCPVCRKACLDKYGEHALHCRELPGFKYRHDFVRDVLMDILR